MIIFVWKADKETERQRLHMYKFIGTLNVESDIKLRTYDVLIKITIESKQTHSKLNLFS